MNLTPYLMVVNVQVAICRGPEYLLIERGPTVSHLPGILDIPGGKAEFGERCPELLEETARREIAEEVGLSLGPRLVYLTSAGFTVGPTQVLNVVFLAPDPGGKPRINRPDEVASISWHHSADLRRSDLIQSWTQGYLQLAEVERERLGW